MLYVLARKSDSIEHFLSFIISLHLKIQVLNTHKYICLSDNILKLVIPRALHEEKA